MEICSIFLIWLFVYLCLSGPELKGIFYIPFWSGGITYRQFLQRNIMWNRWKQALLQEMLLGPGACPGIPPELPKVGQLWLCRIWGVPAWVPPPHLIYRPHSSSRTLHTLWRSDVQRGFSPPIEDLCLGSAHLCCSMSAQGKHREAIPMACGLCSQGRWVPVWASPAPRSQSLQQTPTRGHIHATAWPGFLGHFSESQWNTNLKDIWILVKS